MENASIVKKTESSTAFPNGEIASQSARQSLASAQASNSRSSNSQGAETAATSMDGSRPISMVGGHPVTYPGAFAQAKIRIGNQSLQLNPNQLGNFQRIDVAARAKIQVQVAYPNGQVGDPVAIEVKDGGHLNDGQMAEVTALDSQDTVQFQFQTTDQLGIYRIALRSGSDVKVVNFWVGQQ
jgi:hypothetical protein